MQRALSVALGILVVGEVLFLAAIKIGAAASAPALAIWLVPPVAAFAASWIAPRRKVLLGSLVAVPAVVLIGASNYVFETMGNPVDFPGIEGALLVMGLSLPVVALLCIVSALAGHFASRQAANA
jgi:hypothetical protein